MVNGIRLSPGVIAALGLVFGLCGCGQSAVAQERLADSGRLESGDGGAWTSAIAGPSNRTVWTGRIRSRSGTVDIRPDDPVITRIEAYAGRPYGIGKLSFRLREGDEMIDRSGAAILTEDRSRVLYPVMSRPAAAKFFQNLSGKQTVAPDSIHTIWFLFHGDEPLDLVLHGSNDVARKVDVELVRDRKFQRIVKQWWREYLDVAAQQRRWGDYPPFIETYLTSMLSRRLGLPLPAEKKRFRDPLGESLSLLFDVETNLDRAIRQGMLGLADPGPANQPVPPPPPWVPTDFGDFDGRNVKVEPIARAIPAECFYLRFGTWQNQIWFKRLMQEYGGNLGRMLSVRGFESRIESKFLDQLAVESTEFDDLFGGSLIADVAVIGNDFYFQNGASIGIVFHSKSAQALDGRLVNRRKKFAQAHRQDGCEIQMLEIGGHSVQFMKTPDNRYRSFYVMDGNAHLVTSSLSLVHRFIEAAGGKNSLADSRAFRFARHNMPLDREDTIFVFVPTEFFQRLLGPHYQIEINRRNRAVADMQIVEMAYLAARAEGIPIQDLSTLVDLGFLPERFGSRPDGSQLQRVDDHWNDSIRGRRGFFTPIPDIELLAATPQEVAEYAERSRFFMENLPGMDPMFVGIKRYQRDNHVERVVFDGRIAPFGQTKYRWLLSMLGPPMREKVIDSPRDIIRLSASLKGSTLFGDGAPHMVFAAIEDQLNPKVDLKPTTLLRAVDLIKSAPGYIVTAPSGGYLDWLPRLGGKPDSEGFTHSPILGIWRLQTDRMSAIAFDRDRLERLRTGMAFEPAPRPAHIRLEVGDVAHSSLRDWVNAQNYRRSWQTSIANVKLLNMLIQQFKLDPEQAREIAENLFDVRLVCALDGQYELSPTHSDRHVWCSTSWPDFHSPEMPPDYTAPLLKWFRGMQLEVINARTQFVVHGYLDLQREASSDSVLPSIDLFQGFSNLLSGEQKTDELPENQKKNHEQNDR